MWWARVKWLILAIACCLIPVTVYAYRTEQPQPFSKWDCPSFTKLNNFLLEIWNITNGRYNLDSITIDPNGVRNGTRGELVYSFFSGDEYLCVNSSSPSPGTTWTCINITTFGTICGGASSDTEVLVNNGGTCDGDEGFTFEDSTNLVNINEATDGNSILLALVNDLANSSGSTNETAQMRFGFGSATDNAAIVVGKISDYASVSAEDSFMDFYTDNSGTLTRAIRIDDAQQVGIGTITTKNPLDVSGSAAIGSYAGTNAAPSNGLIVSGQTGIGTAGSPSILGNLTVGSGSGQASLYIRGKNSNGAPAQLYFNDETDSDISSIAWISVANTGTIPFGVNMDFNFDVGANGFFLFDNEGSSVGSPMANEPHGIVVSGQSVGGGLITTNWNITSATTFSNIRYNALYAPTLIGVSGGGAESATNAATLYIDNAPIAGSDFSITNPYAIWVDNGAVRFDGSVTYNSTVEINSATTVTGSLVVNDINTGFGAVELAAGQWTPTPNDIANLDASSSAAEGQYSRVGATVTGSVQITVNPTLTATSTQTELDLPVSSDFGATSDAAGTCAAPGIAGQVAAITADATSNELEVRWISGDITAQEMDCVFSYQVI